MIRKRLLGSISLVGGLFLSILPINAEEQSENTQLNAKIDSTYTLTIPSATTIPFGSQITNLSGYLKVKGNVDRGQSIKITTTSKPLHNAAQNTDIVYILRNKEMDFISDTWSEVELRNGLLNNALEKKDELSIAIDKSAWDSAKAGTYTGTIIFKAEMEMK